MTSRPKHILIVTHYFPPHIGGIETVAYNQAKRLVALGNTVTVVTSRIGSKESRSTIDGIQVIRVGAWNIFERWGVPFPLFSPLLGFAMTKAVREADIVHVHDAFYMSSFIAALCARACGKPIVLTQHVGFISHPSPFVVLVQKAVYGTTGGIIFKLSDLIFTYNDRVKNFLKDRGVDGSKLAVMPNGVDRDLFKPASPEVRRTIKQKFGLSPSKKVFLFVGRFVPKKGFDALFASRCERYQLAFAGGEHLSRVNDEAVFLGKLSPETLSQAYQAADAFILPSRDEGFPLSIQEAMASGLPIITAKDPGYALYDFDEKRMVFIDTVDETSIRSAIDTLCQSDDMLRDMGAYSEQYARANFSWPHIVANIDRAYNVLLQ